MMGKRTSLPRCEVGVPVQATYSTEGFVDCGEPAVAMWEWGLEGEHQPLYVCEYHDNKISEDEQNESNC